MSERTCSIQDCTNRHCARGLCKKHYYAAGHGFQDHQCRVPGCQKRTTAKTADGLCGMHYRRKRINGSLEALKFSPTADMAPADVLHIRSHPSGECVLWAGALTAQNYAVAVQSAFGPASAHRLSWMLANGPIPAGLTVDHLCHTQDPSCPGGNACDHRRCINPDHMELVTQTENGLRQWRQRRARAALA